MIRISDEKLEEFRKRRKAGEAIHGMAQEAGLTWQKLVMAMRYGAKGAASGNGRPAGSAAPCGGFMARQRPRRVADLIGQSAAVRTLRQYSKNPRPAALVFHGETGTGKTSAAWALAADLGCDVAQGEFGGLHQVASGEMSADSVRAAMDALGYCPWTGSGWRVLVVNEAERMSLQAETIWLDRLEPENLPPRCTVVFTTNSPEKLSQRLLDRLTAVQFASDPARLRGPLLVAMREIWRRETRRRPSEKQLAAIIEAATLDGHLSIRRAMNALGAALLTAAAQGAKT